MKRFVLGLIASLALVSSASADTYSGGTGGSITNFTSSSGTLAAANSNGTILSFDSISVDVTHTWVGDLTFWLVAPNGDDVQLWRQPGAGSFGDSSDLGGVYNIFNSGAAGGDFHTAAIAAGTTLAPGDYNRSNVSGVAVPFTGPDPDDFSVFAGDDLNGVWTLRWQDNASGDTGTVRGWSMDITSASAAIPEPGSLALVLLALAGLAGYRRR